MEKLNSKSIWQFFVKDLLLILILELLIFIPLLNAILELDINIYFFIISLLFLNCFITYIIAYLTFYYFKFELLDSKISIQQGIIFKNLSYIPYAHIQNIEINRGVLDRILGLSVLMLHTAGVGGVPIAEGIIPGIEKERAETLIKEIERHQLNSGAKDV